jgi:hypothetical protein
MRGFLTSQRIHECLAPKALGSIPQTITGRACRRLNKNLNSIRLRVKCRSFEYVSVASQIEDAFCQRFCVGRYKYADQCL